MADYYRERDEGVPDGMRTWYQEVGHESHGQVMATSEVWRVQELYDDLPNDNKKSWYVPADEEWKLLWVHVYYGSSATVGNRQVCAAVYPPGVEFVHCILATPGAVQAASLGRYYTMAPGLADLTAFRDTSHLTTPLPTEAILIGGQELRVWDNKNIDAAGDSMWVMIQLAVRKVRN